MKVGDDHQLAVILLRDAEASADLPSAGIIESMASALSAISPASMSVISRVPGRRAPSE